MNRLIFADDLRETVAEGIAHETFHHWMKEGCVSRKYSRESIQDMKDMAIGNMADEGLAVLVSGMKLENHHVKKGRDYEKYTKESFDVFDDFMKETYLEKLKETVSEGFRDRGHFYVVGNEMAKTILREIGMDEFRKLIIETRKDPNIFLRKYDEIKKESMQ